MIIYISTPDLRETSHVLVPTSLVKLAASSPLIELIASPSRTCKSYVKIVVMVRTMTMTMVIIIIIIIIILLRIVMIMNHDVLQTNLATETEEILYQTLSLAARVHSADLETR